MLRFVAVAVRDLQIYTKLEEIGVGVGGEIIYKGIFVPLTSACSTCQREKVKAVVNPQLVPMHKHRNTLYGTTSTISKPY